MFYYKLIYILIQMLTIRLGISDADEGTDTVTPTYNLPGGVMAQDPDDPVYTKLAEQSLQKYLQDSGNSQSYNVIHVENVTTQVVAGILTKINFTVSPTDSDSGDIYKCQSTILEQAWRNFTQIDVTCDMANKVSDSNKQVEGSETVNDNNDPYYKEMAEDALQKYLESNGDSRPHKVVNIIKTTGQVNNGVKTTNITFVVAPVNDGQGQDLICFSNVKDQPENNTDTYCIPNGVSYPN